MYSKYGAFTLRATLLLSALTILLLKDNQILQSLGPEQHAWRWLKR
jgi:hypothetical protein